MPLWDFAKILLTFVSQANFLRSHDLINTHGAHIFHLIEYFESLLDRLAILEIFRCVENLETTLFLKLYREIRDSELIREILKKHESV